MKSSLSIGPYGLELDLCGPWTPAVEKMCCGADVSGLRLFERNGWDRQTSVLARFPNLRFLSIQAFAEVDLGWVRTLKALRQLVLMVPTGSNTDFEALESLRIITIALSDCDVSKCILPTLIESINIDRIISSDRLLNLSRYANLASLRTVGMKEIAKIHLPECGRFDEIYVHGCSKLTLLSLEGLREVEKLQLVGMKKLDLAPIPAATQSFRFDSMGPRGSVEKLLHKAAALTEFRS